MGVAEHKRRKNEACSRGIARALRRRRLRRRAGRRRGEDRRGPEAGRRRARADAVDEPGRDRLLQGPAGADDAQRGRRLARTRWRARRARRRRARCSPRRRSRAGAPDGCLQVVEEPTIPLIEALMADRRLDVIVATGGTAVVRAAYRSGNPALGVGPGNVPALVDATADVAAAARCLVDSKAFDNSILCTNESVRDRRGARAPTRSRASSARNGAHVLDEEEAQRVRDALYPGRPHRRRRWPARTRRRWPRRRRSACRRGRACSSRRSR